LLVVLVAAFVLLQTGREVDSAVARISVPVPASASVPVSMPAAIPQVPSLDAVSLSTIAQRPRGSADLNPAETAASSRLDASEPSSIIRDEPEPDAKVASAEVVAKPELVELLSPVRNALTGSVVRTPEPVAKVSNNSELSSFERNLLSYLSTSYTVQIVGASSESNIQAFVATAQLSTAAGYFETRLNGKPWYVVIAGNFSNKEAAAVFLSALPYSAKASGPWVRSLSDIQSDIQKLQQQP
jgi:DamX protein